MSRGATLPGPKTLVGIVGLVVASLLFTQIPADESGRKVDVVVDAKTEKVDLVHKSGPMYLKVYLDMVGVPTACDGLTGPEINKARRDGKKFTEAECTRLLEAELVEKALEVRKCAPQLWYPGTDYIRYSSISLAYNVGSPTACTSTSFKLLRAGDNIAGCEAAKKFRMAGGRVVPGLVKRRGREWEACVTYLLPGKTPQNLKARMEAWK